VEQNVHKRMRKCACDLPLALLHGALQAAGFRARPRKLHTQVGVTSCSAAAPRTPP